GDFWSTLGVHPHDADQLNDEVLADYERLVLAEDKVVAIGEIGLDYFRDYRPRDLQRHAFLEQLRLAKKLDVPAIVHVRDAWDDALDLIGRAGNSKVILHSFSGDFPAARSSWERGFYISFSGVVTYPKNRYLRDIAGQVPMDRVLIETDCPYLPPQMYRGKRNEPAFVVETAREIANLRGLELSEVGEMTTRNALTLFGLSSAAVGKV
ncbi:TatD family hydrolase, partial [Patescibacteria group bacterium]|nr:TatD family hydrolase [Patescibacteria group bacterium]MBU1703017.1 TatD family hydrolase [Patescibacteria group bacterium]MBU1954066.1 TatD family hydrolase [Patescibacteria group bacterium]